LNFIHSSNKNIYWKSGNHTNYKKKCISEAISPCHYIKKILSRCDNKSCIEHETLNMNDQLKMVL